MPDVQNPTAEISRDNVFVFGGQPTVTYVDRAHLHIQGNLSRALNVPNQIVSLAGPSKSGKTVLCRKVLGERPYIWIEGGQIQEEAKEIWEKSCYILNYPLEIAKISKSEQKGDINLGLLNWLRCGGSILKAREIERTYRIDSMESAIRHLRDEKISLILDDFHYIPPLAKAKFLRNIKGPVFDGLKVVLLSVTHHGLDAVKDETELQGRVYSVLSPNGM